jgi:hypothetical protein
MQLIGDFSAVGISLCVVARLFRVFLILLPLTKCVHASLSMAGDSLSSSHHGLTMTSRSSSRVLLSVSCPLSATHTLFSCLPHVHLMSVVGLSHVVLLSVSHAFISCRSLTRSSDAPSSSALCGALVHLVAQLSSRTTASVPGTRWPRSCSRCSLHA